MHTFSIAALVLPMVSIPGGDCEGSKLFASDASVSASFGRALATDGVRLLVGSPGKRNRAYVFELHGSAWVETATLTGSDIGGWCDDDDLGRAVDIHGDVAVLGGHNYDSYLQGCKCQGGFFAVFERSAGVWQRVLEHFGGCDEGVGSAVAAWGTTVIAEGDRKVLVAERGGTGWSLVQELDPPDNPFGFGLALDVRADLIAVGAPSDSLGGTLRGSVYMYERTSFGWVLQDKVTAVTPTSGERFGADVALVQGNLLVGVPGRDGAGGLVDVGAVDIYSWSGAQWDRVGTIQPSGLTAASGAGERIATYGQSLLVSAPGVDSVITFERVGGQWLERRRQGPWAADSSFGDDVALGRELRAFVGAPGDDSAALNAGTAYVFTGDLLTLNYCFCGSGAPCGNQDADGGCANSTAQGAQIRACGSSSVTADDLLLVASSVPPNQVGMLYMGGTQLFNLPFGDGFRCVDGGGVGIHRFPIRFSGSGGLLKEGPGIVTYSHQNFGAPGHIQPGQTWYFQAWFRDPLGPCGSNFNLSDAVGVTFSD